MIHSKISGYLLAAAVLVATGSARAGIVQNSLSTNLPGCSWANVGSDGNGLITITAGADVVAGYDISGMLDGFDPNLTVIQNITNNTGQPWDSYSITINPAAGFTVSNVFVNPPISQPNYLPNIVGSGAILPSGIAVVGNTITYTGGIVAPGQTLQTYFTFDITETAGQFNYSVLNAPHTVPEPASLAVLGLGAAMLLRRKR